MPCGDLCEGSYTYIAPTPYWAYENPCKPGKRKKKRKKKKGK